MSLVFRERREVISGRKRARLPGAMSECFFFFSSLPVVLIINHPCVGNVRTFWRIIWRTSGLSRVRTFLCRFRDWDFYLLMTSVRPEEESASSARSLSTRYVHSLFIIVFFF
jgi:hypothetical protein